ncbi:MAG: imidazoleglycerol-phosphate dehydratase HisB [Dictyoglomaceae bacterium]|nr:imidazoleglycerol-phosphate dehydratase HisB [Dictyoglomaceae bacterium]
MRRAEVERETKETKIKVILNLDGVGELKGEIPIPYWKHLLETLLFYSFFDLEIFAKGDIEVDEHHLIEDLGLTLGMALKNALTNSNFKRFSHQIIPMDDALVLVAVDISGRPYLGWKDNINKDGNDLIKEFLRAFVNESKITLHVNIISGENLHHIQEAIFKALGLSLREAVSVEERISSTKGKIL